MKNNVISRWSQYDSDIKQELILHPSLGNTKQAIKIDNVYFDCQLDKLEIDSLRNYISRNRERLLNNEPLRKQKDISLKNNSSQLSLVTVK